MKKTLTLLLLLAGISGEVRAETLFWNGSGGHMTWNTEDTNWSQGGASVKYSDGKDVVFADNGSGTVTLSGTFAPASVTVTSLEDYIFDGTGKLTGNMQLDKFQTGTLTINTANDYTGDTNIYKGTLVIGDDRALGTGTIKLFGNTTLNLGQKNLSNKVSLEQGETAFIGNGSISSDLIVGYGKTLTLIGDLDGRGEITLSDNTTLDLGNNILYNNVSLSGETASIGNGHIHGDVVVGDGMTLIFNSGLKVYGQINLGNNTTLHLGNNSLFNDVSLSGSASIGNGHIHGDVFVGNGKTLTLIDNLDGGGEITLSDNATLNLGQNTLINNVALAGETAFIGNGSIRSVLSVGDGKTLTLIGDLEGYQINLGNNTTLDLGKNTLNMYHVSLSGSTTIGNGTIEGDLQVAEGKKLSLQQQITVTGTVNLAANAALDLGGNAFHQGGDVGNRVAFAGDATIGNGTITGDLDVAANQNLTLLHDTTVTGTVNLAANAALDLGGNAFHQGGDVGNRVAFAGDATIGNGTIALANDMDTEYALILGDNATLDLGKHTYSGPLSMEGDSATIGNGTLERDLSVGDGKTLNLCGDLGGSGAITLGDVATLNLGGHAISNNIILNGYDTYIGNGSINHDLAVERGALYLAGNIDGAGNIILDSGAKLRLAGYTLSNSVTLKGNAVVGGGTLDSNLTVGELQILTIEDDLKGKGNIILADDSALSLFNSTLSNSVILNEKARIQGVGTISGDFVLADNASFSWEKGSPLDSVQLTGNITLGERTLLDLGSKTLSASVKLGKNSTITAYSGSSNTTIKTRESADSALLEKVSVSDGLIAGTDRQTSLADGLDINRMGYNLELKNLVLTANNSISVGNGHSITLKDVTIKMSDDICERIESTFYFNLQPLINCDLVMENVLLDASALSLPEGFDPANKSVVFDFGDDVTIKQATGLDMRLGNYWSTSLNLDEQGQVIFTKLVDTPEPTTGTLGLLALAALAARRRRK